MNTLHDTAEKIVDIARRLGASEVTAWASQGTWTDVKQRDGKIEKWQDSQSYSASAAFFVDDRYSVHSTNDLRSDALEQFIGRAIEATRHLEPDPDRRLADRTLMGCYQGELELVDHEAPEIDHRTWVDAVQTATTESIPNNLRSVEGFVWSGSSSQVMMTSNGFAGSSGTTEFGHGADISMEDSDGRLPEAADWAVSRHHADLIDVHSISKRAAERAKRRLGSGPVTSRRGAMLVENRVASRILGTVVNPMYGGSIYEKRSCLSDMLGNRIASTAFSLLDDPHIPRALGSRVHDGDGRPTTQRELVRDGVLQTWLINTYYGRKLGMQPTTSSTSNLVVPSGTLSPIQLITDLPWAIHVDGFLGGNSNPATGKYSFGIRGTLYEKGEPVSPISEMNITGSIFDLLEGYIGAANDPWESGACRSPSLLFDAVQFSGQ